MDFVGREIGPIKAMVVCLLAGCQSGWLLLFLVWSMECGALRDANQIQLILARVCDRGKRINHFENCSTNFSKSKCQHASSDLLARHLFGSSSEE